jgi:hypothetical protein
MFDNFHPLLRTNLKGKYPNRFFQSGYVVKHFVNVYHGEQEYEP